MRLHYRPLLGAALLVLLGGLLVACSTNPVTGERELSLISERQELELGRKNYAPYRQAQGGDYVADPQLVKYVQAVGARLAKVADRPLEYEFRIVNDATPNAWALPGGKIAVNRGLLLELDSEAELAAVLSHEIVHAAARHSAKSLERGALLQGAVLAAGVALSDSEYRQAGMLGASLGANLTQQYYSRDAESEADHYGIRYMVRAGYDPQAAVELQQTFVRLNQDKSPGWLEGLFASHPPSPQRVVDNRKLVATLNNPGGEIGREAYQRATARLRRSKPAYEAYAEAQKALEDGNKGRALQLVDKALRIEPDEAQFHALRGQIRQQQGKDKEALADFDRAVDKNPEYFGNYLLRGLLQRELGRRDAAQRDLAASVARLPTGEGHYGLGLLAEGGGRQGQAIEHFRKAAQAEGEIGKRAGRQLARLDLPHNPQRYIDTGLGLAANGMLRVRLRNNSAVAVRGLRVSIGERNGLLLRELAAFELDRALQPGQQVDVVTRLGPVDAKTLARLQAQVTQAQLAE